MQTEKKRILSYDVIRALAMAAVVLVHCSSRFLYGYPADDISYNIGTVFNGLGRMAVPLFIMLSGALMLDEKREMDIRKALHYAVRIALLLLVWSLIYGVRQEILLPILWGQPISKRAFLRSLLLGHYHMWFLYMIIGLYLITPILRLFIKESNQKYIRYFLLLALCFHFFTGLADLLFGQIEGMEGAVKELSDKFRMGFVAPCAAYYILGWYLTHIDQSARTRKRLYVLSALSLLFIIVGTICFSKGDFKAYNVFMDENGVLVLFYSTGVFTALLYGLKGREIRNPWGNTMLRRVTDLSFGVYMVHIMVMVDLNERVFPGKTAFFVPVLWLATLAISMAVTYVLSLIPHVRKIVRC